MATAQVLSPSPRLGGSYHRKRRHSVSMPQPGFQLPFPHAPKPVSPQLTPSAATATSTSVHPRRRVSTAPLSPHARPATIGHAQASRVSNQRRLATYGEQGIAAASLATLEASYANGNVREPAITTITLDEKSPLRKKQRSSPSNDHANSDSKPGMWSVRTFPFHRPRSSMDSPRRRLGIPSFGWPKPVSAPSPSTTPDVNMEDGDLVIVSAAQPTSDAEKSTIVNVERSAQPGPEGTECSSDEAAGNSRGQLLRRRLPQASGGVILRPMPRPIVKIGRKKAQSPPSHPALSPTPRFSSPLGPERHELPPRPRFPRSLSSKVLSDARYGKNGLRIPSLGERGQATEMYRRVLLRSAQLNSRKREIARLTKLVQSSEEAYVLKVQEAENGCRPTASEPTQSQSTAIQVQTTDNQPEEQDVSEKMDVDSPECGDIELLPDIPDMDFELQHS